MSPGSSTESYPAFARIGFRENPGKNLNQVTCPDRDSNLVLQPGALTLLQKLKPEDLVKRYEFCNSMQAAMEENDHSENLLVFSDWATLH
ncbi:hypothetical protein ANN_26573 [Periplaneta americana]|uniref:Uncharacterized protein n=1 Tax=Periplaneta americana TaxID=6978 RepID=A0ABQ8RYJ0_PERAM|nr:hypothetical protein ANN_26573 [Periplaneta americana]